MVSSARLNNVKLVYDKEYDKNIIEVQNIDSLKHEKISDTNSVADIAYRHLGHSMEAMRFITMVRHDNNVKSHRNGRKLLGDRYYAMCNGMYLRFGDNYDNKAFDLTNDKKSVSYSTSLGCMKDIINNQQYIFKENMINKVKIYRVSGNCGNKEEAVVSIIEVR